MPNRRVVSVFIFFEILIFFLCGATTVYAAPTPCNFWGHLYVDGVAWTDGDPDYHVTMDVVRIVGDVETPVAENVAEFNMSEAIQDIYTLKLSFDDFNQSAIHSGDVCLIYVDGILAETRPVVAGGWNEVDIYVSLLATIPEVIGMTSVQAETSITDAGLTVGTITEACSNDVAAGIVISQDPAGGTEVDFGSAVDLVVSAGRPEVPNVVSMTQADAVAEIEGVAYIAIGNITTALSDTVPAGQVISQTPVAGEASCGTVVDLVVSLGQPVVPNVVGMTQGDAQSAISAVDGISVGSITFECSDTVPAGEVISQSATGPVPVGTEVDLVVSAGKPVVPDVVGMTEADAVAEIEGVAYIAIGNITTALSDTVPAGQVISQTPVAGEASCGTVVDLVVSLGQPVVPNVVGMMQGDAQSAISAVNGISVGTITFECSDTVPAGEVIGQSATGAVQIGTEIDLVISAGQPSVPNVVGMAQAEAVAAIEGVAYITIGAITTALSDTVPAGHVISQTPVAGEASCGTVVDLVVSLGQPVVPNVVGQTQGDAEAAINAVEGITLGSISTQCSDTIPEGEVISQSVNGIVPIGTSVDLVVSSGPCAVEVPAATSCDDITAAGLVCNLVEECSGTVPDGGVISQFPEAGTTVEPGSTVTLTISTGPCEIIVPDVVGLTEAQAETALTEAGFFMAVTYEVTGSPKGYVFSQIPDAGQTLTEGSSVSVVVSMNNPPVADAGPDQADVPLDIAHLDGGGSTDVDGDGLTYIWTIVSKPQGSLAVISDPAVVRPEINIDAYGSYEIRLVVNDGTVDSDPDTVVISTSENLPPVADAGEDQVVSNFEKVCLDGSGSSDPNGDDISYSWVMIAKPDSSFSELDDPTSVNPCFTPDEEGEYVIELTVNDGELDSEFPDQVVISVDVNAPPTANASGDRTGSTGEEICLDGSGSFDPDDDPLTFSWAIIFKPAGSLAELTSGTDVVSCFEADKVGNYVVQLIVSDEEYMSEPDNIVITVSNQSLHGDLDGDGDTDLDDYTVFRGTLGKCEGDEGYLSAADYDGDGCITYDDYRIWYGYYINQSFEGDLDGDGDTDLDDYTVFRGTLGKCEGDEGYLSAADYDGDGCITYDDYRIWYGYYINQ